MSGNSQFAYYLQLALRSFKRNRVLTALMVLAIALGIGASMTTLTVFHVLSGDPIPDKSERLFYVQLDAADLHGFKPGEEPESQLTRFDAEALLREGRAERQALMSGGNVVVTPAGGQSSKISEARYTSEGFFDLFDTPFQYGRGWTRTEDEGRARVAVISRELNQTLFGGGNSVGRTVRVENVDLRIVGVLDDWRPVPRFYDLNLSRYGEPEELFVPFWTARDIGLEHSGNRNCWADSGGDQLSATAPCAWVQYWAQMDPAQAGAYRDYLGAYSEQQRKAGRFQRPPNPRLRDVMQHLEHNKVVPNDVRLQVWLAFGFLLVCLINTVGLLLAKCLRRSSEIGVRRALGASRRDIFLQFLVESGTLGVAGAALGLGLALLGLWAVRQNPAQYAQLAHLDGTMLLTTFALSIGASVLAGLLPAWRACQVTPAIQLKSQ
ncbi:MULTISPECIES: ABC transporter permease [Lysobacter]|uniref:ABC transporter permease n=1 Tax=Lysobacter firmicutimachus TaxID=1792846 RepID=A0ABU8D9K8_9GAMM|nr:ABC transporter permease [Lysobacter antibioticus]